jgi:hypothetical protein
MAYSTPLTGVSNTALTAAQWNASVRDNILETAVAKATVAGTYPVSTAANALAMRVPTAASVSTAETTTSTTYTNLTTTGPQISSLVTGNQALVVVASRQANSTATAECYTSFTITGATPTVAASDNIAWFFQAPAVNGAGRASAATLVIGLTAGANTFTVQYRVSAGTGTFSARHLAVFPF